MKIITFKYQSFLLTILSSWLQKQMHRLRLKSSLFTLILAYPIIIISFLVVFILFGSGGSEVYLPQSSILSFVGDITKQNLFLLDFLFLLLLFPLLCTIFLQSVRKKIVLSRIDMILILFLLALEVSSLFSIQRQISFVWILKFLRGVAFYVVFSRLAFSRKHIHILLFLLLGTLIFESGLGILQFFVGKALGNPILRIDEPIVIKQIVLLIHDIPHFKALGTFPHPNALAAYIVYLLPICVISLFLGNKALRRVSLLAIGISLFALTLTLSRWGILTGTFALFFPLFLLWRKGGIRVLSIIKIFLTTTLFGFFIILLLSPNLLTRFSTFSLDDTSLAARTDLITQSIYMLKENPLGTGPGTFQFFFINYDVTDKHLSERFSSSVHNTYLLLLSESGVLNFFVFVLFLFQILLFFHSSVQHQSLKTKLLSIGFFSSLMVILFHGLWEYRAINDRLWMLFWIFLGLFINILSKKLQKEAITRL